MRINPVNNLTFKAAPTKQALNEMNRLCNEADKLINPEGTFTMLDFYNYSAPEYYKHDTGVGKYTSLSSLELMKTMKPYVGMNAEKIYPLGRFVNKWGAKQGFYCPYERGSLTIGDDNIDFTQLSSPRYGKILPLEELEQFLNQVPSGDLDTIYYENEIGKNVKYPTKQLMYKAFANFKRLPLNHRLRLEYEQFKKKPITQTYDRLALWENVSQHEPNLFENFDKDSHKQLLFESYKTQYQQEIELYKFTQFIAQKQVKDATLRYKKAGIDPVADVAIGFNAEEYWAFPDAFHKDKSIGFNFPLIKYEEMNDKNSDAYKLFRYKFEFVADMFDRVRLDVGTSYIERDYMMKRGGKWDDSQLYHYNYGEKITNIIEDVFKEKKGDAYDPDKIMYEAEGEAGKFIDWTGEKPVPKAPIANKSLILTTQYERNPDPEKGDWGYGSVDFYTDTVGMDKSRLIMGSTNHDGAPTRVMAEGKDKKYEKIRKETMPVLERVFGRSKAYLRKPENFFKTKMAEIQLAPKRYYYFVDVFGMDDAINEYGREVPLDKRFRLRLPFNYEEVYHNALQKDRGYNRPEALAFALRAKGISKQHPVLCKKLDYLGYYLRKKGPLTTKDAEENIGMFGKDEVMEQLKEIDRMA